MTAPIRSMPELLAALRTSRDERQLTHEKIDDIAGWPDGYASKLLAPEPIKNLGWISFGLGLSALGKMLLLVDDPEQIKRVEKRWTPRERPKNGSASSICAKREEIADKSKQLKGFALMQIRGRAGGKASGKTRRAKAMRRRELQRIRSHAARMRWGRRERVAG